MKEEKRQGSPCYDKQLICQAGAWPLTHSSPLARHPLMPRLLTKPVQTPMANTIIHFTASYLRPFCSHRKKWLSLFQDYVGSREGTHLGQPVLEWISQGQQKCQRWCLIWRVLYNARMMDSKRLGWGVLRLAGGSSLRDKCCCLMRVKGQGVKVKELS